MGKARSDRSVTVPAPGAGKRGEDGYVGYLLRQAAHAYQHRQAAVLADISLTPPQFSVLTMIAAYPGLSNADLARLSLLTPQTVSVIVANLLKAGAVDRRPHAVHGRIRQLALTEAGYAMLEAARTRVHALEEALLGDLPEQEARRLRRWLAGVAAGFSAPEGTAVDDTGKAGERPLPASDRARVKRS